jgi:hypothetical protein
MIMGVCLRLLTPIVSIVNKILGVNGRGIVVYVYSGTQPGSTPEDLKAYEDGVYGNYYD